MTYYTQKNRFFLTAKKALIWQKKLTKLEANLSSAFRDSQLKNSTQLYKYKTAKKSSQLSWARSLLLAGLGAMSTVSYGEMILDPIEAGRGKALASLSLRCTHDVLSQSDGGEQDLTSISMRWTSDQPLGKSHRINSVSNEAGDSVATVRVHSEGGVIDIPVKDYSVTAKPFAALFETPSEVTLNLNLADVLPSVTKGVVIQVLFDTPNNTFVSDELNDAEAVYYAVDRNMKMLQNVCGEVSEGATQDRIVFKELPIVPPRVSNFDGDSGLLTLYGVNVGGKLYDVWLTQTSFSHFSLRDFSLHTGDAPDSISTYDASALILDIPKLNAFGQIFKVVLKNSGNFEFDIVIAETL